MSPSLALLSMLLMLAFDADVVNIVIYPLELTLTLDVIPISADVNARRLHVAWPSQFALGRLVTRAMSLCLH